MERKSFEEGIILALVSPPIPHVVKKQPIAYSYNGVILPKLPEWDRERYPYAFISFNSYVQKYFLTVSTDIGYRYMASDGMYTMGLFCQYTCEPDSKAWSMYREDDGKTGAILDGGNWEIVWSSSDILVEGSEEVHFSASDPIPIYE